MAGFTRWPFWRRWFGQRSEQAAAAYLRRLGYRILAANLHESTGEIDLLARDGHTLVVVEVRSSAKSDAERIAATVNHTKQKRLTEATLQFLTRHRLLNHPVRFDVIVIIWPEEARKPEIIHHPHAFEATGRFQMFS